MSHNMSNKEIISACRQHKKNITALKANVFFLKSLGEEVATLTKRVEAAEDVSYIYKGVPMVEMGSSGEYSIFPVSDDEKRYATIYRNAHNNKTWGLNLRYRGYDAGGEWMGAKWKTKRACVEAAKEWIATGAKPESNGGNRVFHSVENLCERMQNTFSPVASEMERTLPTCDNCLIMSAGGACDRVQPCDDFIPHDWKNHILVEGEWWS